MIPTIFGLTIVSFCIMKLAPGDPLQDSNSTGSASEGSLNRERYLITKRDLKLDLPLLFNFRQLYDYRPDLKRCAFFRSMSRDDLAGRITDGLPQDLVKFARLLRIKDFEESLKDPQRHRRLATEIQRFVQVYCEDAGNFAVTAAMELLDDPESSREVKLGLIDCLNFMVVEKHLYTFTKARRRSETALILGVWKTWWRRNENKFSALDPDREAALRGSFETMVHADSRKELFALLEDAYFERDDMPFFAKKLLGETDLQEKVVAAVILKLYISRPLEMQAGRSASDKVLKEVIENWHLHYDGRSSRYKWGLLGQMSSVCFDTQYAHMVKRLVTFQFGRSATKSRDPVSKLLWDAIIVSAPLMLLAQLVIYLVALPAGVVCAVNRGNAVDKSVSLLLFFLYSIPPFVAGMLFLLFFCYADYLQWFPMERLHSLDAANFGFFRYTLDYCWHAFLPVMCLSLFSLAAVGQDYIRTARAKGLSNSKVIFKHAFRNSLIPVLTLFSNILPAMLGGSILIEYLFNIPGMGRLGFESILRRDFPTLMAILYVDALLVMFSILFTDILYVLADPRISFAAQEGA